MLSTNSTVLITGHKGFLGRHVTRAVEARGCKWLGMDIDDLIPDEPIDGIIHLAAVNGVSACDLRPVDAVETNVLMTAQMLMWARTRDAWFVHVGSQEARDNIYGITKRAATDYAKAFSRLTHVPVSFVEPCTMFGKGMNEGTFLERVRLGEEFKAVYGSLTLCSVEDVVSAIIRVCGEAGRLEYIKGDTVSAYTLERLIRYVSDPD